MRRFISLAALFLLALGLPARADSPAVEPYLLKGQLQQGEAALIAGLAKNPADDQARFGLGVLQFIRAVERLGQSLYRYGMRSELGQEIGVPFLRLPVPVNPKGEKLSYKAFRQIFREIVEDLTKAEATLGAVRDEKVKLPLKIGRVQLDVTGDPKKTEEFHVILARYMGRGRVWDPEQVIGFDRGDVAWLRGYCHLLLALAEIVLAHDGQDQFERTGHLFFQNVDSPYRFLAEPAREPNRPAFDFPDLVDAVAFIHLLRLPVIEPTRMKSALEHLEKMLALSKESWTFILAETDDDNEWLPNPRQKGVLGVPVQQQMIDSWLEFVAEGESLLAGKRLAPFWRGNETRGVNIRRVFLEPRTMDLILWIQGSAAAPYLEEGVLTRKEVWNRLQQVFRGEFLGFAVWFN